MYRSQAWKNVWLKCIPNKFRVNVFESPCIRTFPSLLVMAPTSSRYSVIQLPYKHALRHPPKVLDWLRPPFPFLVDSAEEGGHIGKGKLNGLFFSLYTFIVAGHKRKNIIKFGKPNKKNESWAADDRKKLLRKWSHMMYSKFCGFLGQTKKSWIFFSNCNFTFFHFFLRRKGWK